MVNNRNDKYNGDEESEYHFSDEVSYEVEPESPKPGPGGSGRKENILNRLNRSKRMIISIVVFLVLVFVVYKMIAPPATVPTTDIAAAPVAPSAPMMPPQQQVATMPQQAPVATPGTVIPEAPTTNQVVVAQPPAIQPPSVAAQQATVVTPTTMPGQAMPPQQQVVQQPQQQVATQQQPMQPEMPAVIAVQSPLPTTYSVNQTTGAPVSPAVSAGMVNLSAESERVISQLQAEYAQRITEYAGQNKALQEQVQALSSRVASMEAQLTQLVQALTHQNQAPTPPAVPAGTSTSTVPPSLLGPETRLSYNVQAIIPGRAWLRSDSGETITVTEGDAIKDLGRVTKIDPYDGIVEVNTGSKVVSLSYGNGG
jgi:hypothetical protein